MRSVGSAPDPVPRAARTWKANPWMVVTVAASNSVTACCNRRVRSAQSSAARWTASRSRSVSDPGDPDANNSAVSTRRCRTLARSSLAAARVKVTMSSSEAVTSSSATKRVARVAKACVLPVPALASMAVRPRGNGPKGFEVGGSGGGV